MTRYLARLGNRLIRYDIPVEQHRGDCHCLRCREYARAFLRGVQEAMAYQSIRGAEADMARLVTLRDGYRGARS